jgi:hypothetical protein
MAPGSARAVGLSFLPIPDALIGAPGPIEAGAFRTGSILTMGPVF